MMLDHKHGIGQGKLQLVRLTEKPKQVGRSLSFHEIGIVGITFKELRQCNGSRLGYGNGA